MVKLTLQNLDQLQKIVTETGIPTQYFIRFIQNRGGALTDLDALLLQLQEIVDAIKDNEIIAGEVLAGGGKLADGDVTIDHEPSLVAPGTYTNANITVDEFGHLQFAEDGTGGAGGIELEEAGVPVAGGPFSTLNLVSGATAADAGGGIADLTFAGGGGGGGALQVIQKIVLTSDAANFDFTSIPPGYDDLVLVVEGASAAAAAYSDIAMRVNADTGSNYDLQRSEGNGSIAYGGQVLAAGFGYVGYIPAASGVANSGSNTLIEMPGYSRTTFQKSWNFRSGVKLANSAGNMFSTVGNGWWRSTAAINRITLTLITNPGNFKAGTVATLYGRGGTGGGSGGSFSGARVVRSADSSSTSGDRPFLDGASAIVEFDTAGFYDAANSRFVIPPGVSKVVVSANAQIDGGGGDKGMRLRHTDSGGTVKSEHFLDIFDRQFYPITTGVLNVVAGDLIKLEVYSSSSHFIESSGRRTWASIQVVG